VKIWPQISVAVVLWACSSRAAEIVHLDNGNDFHCARHEQIGSATRLYLDKDAYVDMPSRQISGYEPDLDPVLPQSRQPIPGESLAPTDIRIPIGVPSDVSSRNSSDSPRDAALPNSAALNLNLTLREHVEQAARRTGIDPDFIESVIRIESGYNPAAISPKGARGLMQLMPSTALSLGVRDSFNPVANIDGGSRYLRDLLIRYDGDAIKALAAYNSGPERVEQYKGVPPFRETRSYVARVIKDFNRRKLSGVEGTATLKGSPEAKEQSASVSASKQSNLHAGR
jgi:hypothetical protein